MLRESFLATLAVAAFAGAAAAQPVAFTQWTFNNYATGQIVNNPAPSTGRGTAVPLGMTNNYTYSTSPVRTGSITTCDVTSGNTGSSDPTNVKFWRVRGSYDGTLGNAGVGYALAAPQYTQGAEFDVSTVNFFGIVFSFDWFNTNFSVRHAQVQYSINGGTTWTSIGPVLTAVANGWLNNSVYDFSGVTGVDDNPLFRVRLVSVYDQSLIPPAYGGASGGVYNNASGNWRFDMVTFKGTAIRSVGPAATGQVNPPAVCSAGGPLKFTVTAQSGAGPLSTGLTVTADLSPLGLSASQAFFDDGTNGDAIAGDGVFTYAATVPGGRPLAPVSITATVSDAQSRSGSTAIPVAVADCSGNSAARVVISQTFSAGGNIDPVTFQGAPFDADYVELYNRSGQTVDLTGWSVQYASQGSAAGFDNTGDQVLLSGVVRPGQHILVRMSDPVPGFTALPRPDFAQIPGFGGMGDSGGRVALVRSTTLIGTNYNDPSIEDFVGYGAGAISFEGAGPAATPTPVISTATVRRIGGTQDSNQNFNDFQGGAATPHNRASGGFLAGYAASSVSALCAGTDVTFTVGVSPAPTSTGIQVAADVSEVVGSPASVLLFDDGSHGDLVANDGTYTVVYTVPVSAAQGNRTVRMSVTDLQGQSDVSLLPLAVGNCGSSTAEVVISKVYGGGGNAFSGYNSDFAEIFNRSSRPVNLTGWSFQSARITDLTGFVSRICPLSGVINPGEYRLIVTNQISATGAALPTADFTPGTLFGMESSFGRVVLVSSTNFVGTDYTRSDVVDLVGYGSATQSFEGVGPTGTLGDVYLAVRKQAGCQDTNQNAIDFDVVLALALPNNSLSPAHSCGPIACSVADITGIGGPPSLPDGQLTGDDFVAYINAFAGSEPLADIVGIGGLPPPDGLVTGDDFNAFINAFATGCP